jgi:GTP cyclohydrolase I
MPDVASGRQSGCMDGLDWVGMEHIDLPMHLPDDTGTVMRMPVKAGLFVDLEHGTSHGIHMSRLYLLLQDFAEAETITPASLHGFLRRMLNSHADISNHARVDLRFDYLLRRPALQSEHSGWKAYPAEIRVTGGRDKTDTQLRLSIPYSSTCPCSAALARQLTANAFREDFARQDSISVQSVLDWLNSEKGSTATPHSQRSWAHLQVRLPESPDFPLPGLIDAAEETLQTAVQTAVKREDEQAFARLNGSNLMFCEDAARRLARMLKQYREVTDFRVKVEHMESLHPHDAVAVAREGRVDGTTIGSFDPR